MAIFRHISTKLVLTLDAGQVNGKKATKRVTISNLREDISADEILAAVSMLEKLLEHPVDLVKKHTVSAIERVADAENEKSGAESTETVRENAAETAMETAGADGTRVNDDTAATEGLQHDRHAAARAFGGGGKNGLLGRSSNDGYLKEPRLPVLSLGNNRALRTPPRAAIDGAVIKKYQTPPGYTRPPP